MESGFHAGFTHLHDITSCLNSSQRSVVGALEVYGAFFQTSWSRSRLLTICKACRRERSLPKSFKLLSTPKFFQSWESRPRSLLVRAQLVVGSLNLGGDIHKSKREFTWTDMSEQMLSITIRKPFCRLWLNSRHAWSITKAPNYGMLHQLLSLESVR